MDFKAPDNIYWLFSSSAQAIAACIGFLAACFFFVYDSIDKQVEKDETLEEIYADIRVQILYTPENTFYKIRTIIITYCKINGIGKIGKFF